MHSLLTSAFPKKYSTKPNASYEVLHQVVNATTASFALSDQATGMLVDMEEGIWCCNNRAGTDIHVINYEQYIGQYRKGEVSKGKRCDFVLYDARRSHFVVVELTHCKQNSLKRPVSNSSPKTKEETAETKYRDTIQTLCGISEIRSFIEQYPVKSCVFACRLKDDQDTQDTVSRAMDGFQAAVQEVGTITRTKPLVIENMGFRYIRCIYPEPYVFQ